MTLSNGHSLYTSNVMCMVMYIQLYTTAVVYAHVCMVMLIVWPRKFAHSNKVHNKVEL
jgi:hypothetical protein